MPPSTIVLLDNIVAVLRQSPALVEHHHRHHVVVLMELISGAFAGSESGDRHRAERVLKLGGSVVSVLDRSGREDV